MLGHQRLELPHQPRLLPDREVGVDPVLERLKPRLLQPRDRALRERLIGEIGQRRAAPQRQRLPQPLAARRASPGLQRAATVGGTAPRNGPTST